MKEIGKTMKKRIKARMKDPIERNIKSGDSNIKRRQKAELASLEVEALMKTITDHSAKEIKKTME
jgi:hypothetical protein